MILGSITICKFQVIRKVRQKWLRQLYPPTFSSQNILMKKIETAVPDVLLLEPRMFGDIYYIALTIHFISLCDLGLTAKVILGY